MPNVRRAAHGRRDFQLEFRDSLTEMDSRLRGNDEDGRDARAPRGCMDSRFRGNDVISARRVAFRLAVIPAKAGIHRLIQAF